MSEPFVVRPRPQVLDAGGPTSAPSPRRAARKSTVADEPLREESPFVVAAAVRDPGDGNPKTTQPEKPHRPPTGTTTLAESVTRHSALGPLLPYLDDPDITDLFINGSSGLFVDRGDGAALVRAWIAEEEDVRELAVALIGIGGRHIDDANPCVDVRLEDGVRIHAVLPPVSAEGTVISIRIPRMERPDLDDLQRRGMFGPAVRVKLEDAVARRTNLLVTGAAGAGKTTLLAAMLSSAPAAERIVTIEDVAELRLRHPHHVRLEARQANLEGAGAIGMPRLVREALRMRPDRLVVGECRGEEVRELLSALNTGHDGGAGTLHANGLHDVPARLEALGALAGLDDGALARQVASAIGCVLHVQRDAGGERRVAAAGRPVIGATGRLEIEDLPWFEE